MGLVILIILSFAKLIKTLQDSLLRAFRHRRHGIIFVVEGEVIENLFAFLVHPPESVPDDHGDFIGKGRVVREQGGNSTGQDVAVTVLMLQTFAVQGSPSGGAPEQKSLGFDVACRPDQIAYPLKTKHRVEDIKRDRIESEIGIGGPGSNKRTHRSRLRDPLFQDLSVHRLLIIEQGFTVHRFVQLTLRRKDTDLTEQGIHPEGPCLIRNDRDNAPADLRVPQELTQHADKKHGRGGFQMTGLFQKFPESIQRHLQPLGPAPFGKESPQASPPLQEVFCFHAVTRRAVERRLHYLFVFDRNVESGSKFPQFPFIELFLLMGDVPSLAGLSETIPFDRLSQDHRGRTLVFHGRIISGIDFLGIMPAPQQLVDLVICEIIGQLRKFGIFAKKMSSRIAARLDGIFLVIPVHRLFHPPSPKLPFIAFKERLPVRPPNALDPVPARAPESDKRELLIKRMEEAVDGDYQKYSVEPGSYTRRHFFGKYPELSELANNLTDDQDR